MTSDCKVNANRANARASTGPKTADGRARSARNALRHALTLPVCSNPALSEEVETLVQEIAGPGVNPETQQLARKIAEAQIDLRRVRYARHQLLSRALADPYYEPRAARRQKEANFKRFLLDGSRRGIGSSRDAGNAGQVCNDSIARGKTVARHGPLRTASAVTTQICHSSLRWGAPSKFP